MGIGGSAFATWLHKTDYSLFMMSLVQTIITRGCASPLLAIAGFTTWISNCQECGKGRVFQRSNSSIRVVPA